MKKKILLIVALSIFYSAIAGVISPISMLQDVSASLLHELNLHQNEVSSDKKIVDGIIKRVLIPKINKETMAKLVIGPTYWRSSTVGEHQMFIDQFEIMVTDNYARAFSEYTGQTIQFLPFRGNYVDFSKVEVKSIVHSRENDSFDVDYKLEKNKSGDWLIYDFSSL